MILLFMIILVFQLYNLKYYNIPLFTIHSATTIESPKGILYFDFIFPASLNTLSFNPLIISIGNSFILFIAWLALF